MTLAGIRRYAAARGWEAEAVPKLGLGPKRGRNITYFGKI